MSEAENLAKFAASEAKMRADGLPDAAILVSTPQKIMLIEAALSRPATSFCFFGCFVFFSIFFQAPAIFNPGQF